MRAAAEAVEDTEPQLAVELYRLLADDLIDRTGRRYYRIAADYLARTRRILVREGAEEEWTELIEGIRETHKRKPALLDELRRKRL